jgi:hypothetical protein
MALLKGLPMNTVLQYALAALLPALSASQALACYTVYNRSNQVVYHAAAAPVDMRYQLHQTLPAVYPGGHLVFSVTDTGCPAVNERSATRASTVNALSRRESYVEGPSAAPARTPDPGGPSGNR